MAEPTHISIFFDAMPNNLRAGGEYGDTARKQFIESLKAWIDSSSQDILSRCCTLPAIIVHDGPHSSLLDEARKLFYFGFFYPCVAMCGITAERIVMDLFAVSLFIRDEPGFKPLPPAALKELEAAGAKAITHFLLHAGVLEKKLLPAFQGLGKLRNDYAHAAGTNPKDDAAKAIGYLHEIVEGTVSVFRRYHFVNGQLRLKPSPPPPSTP